jgi:hypothetical protein
MDVLFKLLTAHPFGKPESKNNVTPAVWGLPSCISHVWRPYGYFG